MYVFIYKTLKLEFLCATQKPKWNRVLLICCIFCSILVLPELHAKTIVSSFKMIYFVDDSVFYCTACSMNTCTWGIYVHVHALCVLVEYWYLNLCCFIPHLFLPISIFMSSNFYINKAVIPLWEPLGKSSS